MEDFVTYEQAVRLKELGFNLKVNHYYNSKKDLCENLDYIEESIEEDDNTSYRCFNSHWILGIICSAPTLTQAVKWLREVKGIIIVCTPEINKSNCNDYIKEHYTGRWYCESNSVIKTYPTYEKALSAGINAALQQIIMSSRHFNYDIILPKL